MTPGLEPTWRNWWDRNREEFFDVRARRKGESTDQSQRYDTKHQSATPEEIRKVILPVLLAGLKDGSGDVRDAAAIAVGRAGRAPEVAALLPLLKDSNRKVREAALLGVGLLRDARGEDALIKVVTGSTANYRERGVAAIALGLSGGKRARDVLQVKLGASRPFPKASRVKARELEGCRALGLSLVKSDDGGDSLQAAFKKNRTKDKNFRPMVLTGLARLAVQSAAPLVKKGLAASDMNERRGAAILAGRVIPGGDEKAVKSLIKSYHGERDAHARGFLLISLGRLAHPLAVKELRAVLKKGKRRSERGFAAIGLGISGDHASVDVLKKMLKKEKDASLRGAIAVALGILDDRDAITIVQETLKKTGNPELRADLVTALAMLASKEALPQIRKVTSEAKNARLMRDCGLALALLEDASSLDLMLKIMENSGSIQIKGGMASAIGRTGDRRSIERLVALVKNRRKTDQTRAFAIVALGLIADKSPRSEFARISIDCNYPIDNAEALRQVIDIF